MYFLYIALSAHNITVLHYRCFNRAGSCVQKQNIDAFQEKIKNSLHLQRKKAKYSGKRCLIQVE